RANLRAAGDSGIDLLGGSERFFRVGGDDGVALFVHGLQSIERILHDLNARNLPGPDGLGELDGGQGFEVHGAYSPSLSSTRTKSAGSASSGSVSPILTAVSDNMLTKGRTTSSR